MKSRFVAVALLVLAHTAYAADEDFANREARARFEEGIAFVKQADFEHARVKFQETLALESRPAVLMNLAICEKNLGRLLDATLHLEQYIADPTIDSKRRADVERELIAPMRMKLGQLHIQAPSGSTVVLDGARTLGKAPLLATITVGPGDHSCTATGQGVREVHVNVKPGETIEVDLVSATPTETTVNVRPAAGYIVPSVLGGLGLVGIGVGIGFGVASTNASNDAKSAASPGICVTPSSACDLFREHASASRGDQAASIVGYVAGSALLASAIVMAIVWPSQERKISVTPTINSTGVGFTLLARF